MPGPFCARARRVLSARRAFWARSGVRPAALSARRRRVGAHGRGRERFCGGHGILPPAAGRGGVRRARRSPLRRAGGGARGPAAVRAGRQAVHRAGGGRPAAAVHEPDGTRARSSPARFAARRSGWTRSRQSAPCRRRSRGASSPLRSARAARRLPEGARAAFLLDVWVAKEAHLKRTGEGLAGGMARLTVAPRRAVCSPGTGGRSGMSGPSRCPARARPSRRRRRPIAVAVRRI